MKHNLLKPSRTGFVMVFLELAESASFAMCSIAVFLWMSIGSLSRSTRSEVIAQRVIAIICISSSILLFIIHYSGGEIWGSSNIARPLAVVAIVVAISAVMNIKGKDVQGETNPHKIMKKRRDEQ